MTCLVFPANPIESRIFALQMREQGDSCLGASLLPDDPWAQACFEQVFALPHLNDTEFWAHFEALLSAQAITAVASSHPVVYRHLKNRYDQSLKLRLIEGIDSQRLLLELCQQHSQHWLDSQLARHWPLPLKPLPEADTLARWLFHSLQIGGQSAPDKLLTLAAVMASAPVGDVVELGVFRGRSLWMLAALARHYTVGQSLGVDPWFTTYYSQNSPLVDQALPGLVAPVNREQLACAALWPDFAGQVNLIKAPSVEAEALYAQGQVQHAVFGQTQYSGQIAVLHIDGNHAYESVQADIAAWFPHLAPAAWIIFDDYIWRFGDGPQRAADTWLSQNRQQVAAAFVVDETLFVRLQSA